MVIREYDKSESVGLFFFLNLFSLAIRIHIGFFVIGIYVDTTKCVTVASYYLCDRCVTHIHTHVKVCECTAVCKSKRLFTNINTKQNNHKIHTI